MREGLPEGAQPVIARVHGPPQTRREGPQAAQLAQGVRVRIRALAFHRAAQLLTARGGLHVQRRQPVPKLGIQPHLMVRVPVAQDAGAEQVLLKACVHEQGQAGTLPVIPALGVLPAGLFGGAGRSGHPRGVAPGAGPGLHATWASTCSGVTAVRTSWASCVAGSTQLAQRLRYSGAQRS